MKNIFIFSVKIIFIPWTNNNTNYPEKSYTYNCYNVIYSTMKNLWLKIRVAHPPVTIMEIFVVKQISNSFSYNKIPASLMLLRKPKRLPSTKQ